MYSELTAYEKIKRAKIQLQNEKPFFSYILLHLTEREVSAKECKTLGVNKYGRMVYNPIYVNSLSFELLKSAVCHEALHIVLKHFWRMGNRNMPIFNISSDAAVNSILGNDDFELSPDWIILNSCNELKICGEVVCENADKKSSEEIYDNIYEKLKKKGGGGKGKGKGGKGGSGKGKGNSDDDENDNDEDGESGDGKGNKDEDELPETQDSHNVDDEEGKEDLGDGKGNMDDDKIEDFWEDVLVEASVVAKQRGKLPKGMERFIGDLINPKVNWKHIIHKIVSNVIPFDYRWNKPAKKSYSTGIYFPRTFGEHIEVVISIDTSGSIRQKELTEFLSEIVGMAKSFNSIIMTIIICDSEIHEVYEIKNGNIPKILGMKIKGGGGTSHIPIYEWMKKNKPQAKLLINFTDGYTEFPEKKPSVETLWVLCENSVSKDDIPFGKIIKMRYEKKK
jgi:predicted metal-dependent peptidase